MYEYKATVVDVYDGDTIKVDIDLGFGVVLSRQTIRLTDINTPEVKGVSKTAGISVREWVKERILGKEIVLHTKKDSKGKYGRWLGVVIYVDESSGTNLNEELVRTGRAERMSF